MTVVGCINAIGQALPPFIIFNAKNLNLDWTNGEVPGTMYGLSENGWIDMVLFKEWFHQHFYAMQDRIALYYSYWMATAPTRLLH